jgi:hypothetical protein
MIARQGGCIMKSFTFPDPPDPTKARGRKYTVTTEALGTCFTPMNGHWLYEPSVILPCPLTGNKFVLLIVRNKVANQPETSGLVMVARTSTDGISFGSETVLLENTSQNADNICDMIDARPIWDDSQWHIYMQARIGTPGQQCPNNTNHIVEARGSSLNPPTSNSFQWEKETGNNHARKIITGTAPSGIGQDMQWYNPSRYGLPSYPFMVTYNDWGANGTDNDNRLRSQISPDDVIYNAWYGPEDTPWPAPLNFNHASYFPDSILLASLDFARKGNPGIGFASHCYEPDTRHRYGKAIGFFNNPSKVPSTSPQTGWAFEGSLESVSDFPTPDPIGPRMFEPSVARNEYGYIPPQSYHGYPRTWVTYLYYNPSQIKPTNDPPGPPLDGCGGYTAWKTLSQSIAVSRLTITERSTARLP